MNWKPSFIGHFVVLLACLLSLQSIALATDSGVVYYVCNHHQSLPQFNGDDSNDGLTPETAWKSFDFALSRVNQLEAGDTLAFCRGGQFYHQQPYNSAAPRIANRNSTAQNPLLITSYIPDPKDSSCVELPVIFDNSVKYLPEDETNPACDNTPQNCDSKPRRSNGLLLLTDSANNAYHNEGLIIEELILRSEPHVFEQIGTAAGLENWRELLPTQAIIVGHDFDFLTVRHVEIYGFGGGIAHTEKGFAGPNDPDFDGSNDHNTFQRLLVHNNATQGFRGAGNHLKISESVFINNGAEKNGKSTVRNHHIYLSKGAGIGGYLETRESAYQNVEILNNALYQSALWDEDENPLTPDICGGIPLTAHGAFNNLSIIGNIIWEDYNRAQNSCWGISLGSGYTYKHLESLWNLKLNNNVLMDVGNNILGCSFCNEAEISGNLLIGRVGPDAYQSKGPFSINAITVPQGTENDYDPCYQLINPAQPRTLQKVELSLQNGLPTDPLEVIEGLSNFPETFPTTNINHEVADGQWLNQNGELLQWISAEGSAIDKPFAAKVPYLTSRQNTAYNSLNCDPNHVLISDNQTRHATIKHNISIIDAFGIDPNSGEVGMLSSKSESIELGDNLFDGLHELDLNHDGKIDASDEADIYSVFSNQSFYSSRTRIENETCAVDIHPTSAGVDSYVDGGNPNTCTVYDINRPAAPETINVNRLLHQVASIKHVIPTTSEEFWFNDQWPRASGDPQQSASTTIYDAVFGECEFDARLTVSEYPEFQVPESDNANNNGGIQPTSDGGNKNSGVAAIESPLAMVLTAIWFRRKRFGLLLRIKTRQ